MATDADKLREAAGLLEQIAVLQEKIASAEAQHERLTKDNSSILASLRVQAIAEAKEQVARQVAAERAALAIDRQKLDELLHAARQDRTAATAALGKIQAEAEQSVAKKIAAAHSAARMALNAQ